MTDWNAPVKTKGWPARLACQACGNYLPLHPIYKDFLPYCSPKCAETHTPCPCPEAPKTSLDN